MNGWMMSVTIIVPIIATALIAVLVTNRSNRIIVQSTNKMIGDASKILMQSSSDMIEIARDRGVNCIEKSINAVTLEIKELAKTTVSAIEANGKSTREASLKVIETQNAGLVKALETLAKKQR